MGYKCYRKFRCVPNNEQDLKHNLSALCVGGKGRLLLKGVLFHTLLFLTVVSQTDEVHRTSSDKIHVDI